jgi:DNA topoisomerase-1
MDATGRPVRDPGTLDRIRALAIPPAWTDVWICAELWGHIQATGLDAAGRRQYLYHQRWRDRRDRSKFRRMREFARGLPALRERVERDLRLPGLPMDKALAAAVRLLDRGCFRIGSEAYAERNNSYGLATIRKDLVHLCDGGMRFDCVAKGGKRQVVLVRDARVEPIVRRLRRRRTGGPELLAYREDGRWRDVRSGDVNDYIKGATGNAFTAKDFRTWHATVLAAIALSTRADVGPSTTARRRAVSSAVRDVAEVLGNTPAVCRGSYVDPRVIDRYFEGVTIAPLLEELPDTGDGLDPDLRARVERAVLELVDDGAADEASGLALAA